MTPLPASVRSIVVYQCARDDCGTQFATYGELPRGWKVKNGQPVCRICCIHEKRREARRRGPWKR